MTQLQPMPLFLNETAGADRGLICGYQLQSQGPAREVTADGIVQAIAQTDTVTWLHFNLSDARARRWLLDAAFVPSALREVLQEHDENRRIEVTDGGLLLVISDFTYEDESDPSEVATLWCYADHHLLITARVHALKSSDELRLRMRTGITATSGVDLAAQLLDIRTARVKQLATGMTRQLDDVEDEILAGNIKQQREQLGRARRLCARLRREFAPERADLGRVVHRSVHTLPESDRGVLESSVEGLGFAIEEIAELYERAKLLQEELASRLAENTGRNLYVLSILTAVLLPMTLVTGFYGMNVAHLPGANSIGLVTLLILASGGITLAVLFWRRLL
jgi:zinc transporter